MNNIKLYLHIGTEKTGSSFLQTLLSLNREYLRDFNIHYPEAGKREKDALQGKISPGNGAILTKALLNKDEELVERLLTKYKKDAEGHKCSQILISSENLIEAFSDQALYLTFDKICKKLDIETEKMLLILRDPIDQALSLYKHRAKNGDISSIDEWVRNGYYLADHLDDFFKVIDKNKINCIFRRYEKHSDLMQKILFDDFLLIGKPKKTFSQPVNPSLTISELLILNTISSINSDLIKPYYNRLIKIPLNEKVKDVKIENYYRSIISQHLVSYNDVWQRCNEKLAPESIRIPEVINAQNLEKTEELCFSKTQTNEIVAYLLEAGSINSRFKIMLYKTRLTLAKRKNRFLKLLKIRH